PGTGRVGEDGVEVAEDGAGQVRAAVALRIRAGEGPAHVEEQRGRGVVQHGPQLLRADQCAHRLTLRVRGAHPRMVPPRALGTSAGPRGSARAGRRAVSKEKARYLY